MARAKRRTVLRPRDSRRVISRPLALFQQGVYGGMPLAGPGGDAVLAVGGRAGQGGQRLGR